MQPPLVLVGNSEFSATFSWFRLLLVSLSYLDWSFDPQRLQHSHVLDSISGH